jgi:hypothetical protein
MQGMRKPSCYFHKVLPHMPLLHERAESNTILILLCYDYSVDNATRRSL